MRDHVTSWDECRSVGIAGVPHMAIDTAIPFY